MVDFLVMVKRSVYCKIARVGDEGKLRSEEEPDAF